MKKYDLYLFDFDGTLLDTFKALDYVFSVGYEHVGIKFDKNDTPEFARIPLIDGYKRYNGDTDKWEEFVKYIEDALDFPQALSSNEPFPETYEFIKHMRDNHLQAGIVTSNKTSHVKDVLKVMNIPLDTFSVYLGSNHCRKVKPDPTPINMALEMLNYKGPLDKVVYVGDGINDALAANRAGVDAVLVDRIEAFTDSPNYIRIHSLMELFK